MNKKFFNVAAAILAAVCAVLTPGCGGREEDFYDPSLYDLSLPVLLENGWHLVFEDNFDGSSLNENIIFGDGYEGDKMVWTYSPNYERWPAKNAKKSNWWCPDTVSLKDGALQIRSFYDDNHACGGVCAGKGRFTGGIETRVLNQTTGESQMLFSQAFGYFEARVKFPNAPGLWSAFWLQSTGQGKINNDGKDGTEIDIYESAFIKHKTRMGHALLWNGYGEHARVEDYITDTDVNLYDGYHTFALKWTPEYYVFYVDHIPTWASSAGGVAKVKEFLRLTVEIDTGDGYGPHGEFIGYFRRNTDAVFYVDYVKVWQNSGYLPFVTDDSTFF